MTQQELFQEIELSKPELYHIITDIYLLVLQRPFPAPHIITDTISRMLPTLPQRLVYQLTQRFKASIYEHSNPGFSREDILTHGNS